MSFQIVKPTKQSKPSISDIVYVSPKDLTPWPDNPRTHPEKQVHKIAVSMEKIGFTSPPLVDENRVILSGHVRVLAAHKLGLTSIPVRVIAGLSTAQKRAYVISDNKLAMMSSWDPTLLVSEMKLIIEDGLDIQMTSFDTAEVDLLFDGSATSTVASDPDDLKGAALQCAITSQVGDLWQLGEHRILCGDALLPQSYERLMPGEKAQMVITDPPYNVKIEGHAGGNGKIKHKDFAMASSEMSSPEFTTFLNTSLGHMAHYAQNGAIVFVYMDWRHLPELQQATLPLFGAPRQMCVWKKDNGGMGTFYRSQHEICYVFKNGDGPHINNFELGQHGRYRTNVWSYAGVNTFAGKGYQQQAMHPTVKPVAMIADAIRDCSHRQGIVLDAFAGSGTVLIAAQRTGRHARAIEFEPQYVDVAINRWQALTKKQAVLQVTGQTWDEVRQLRAPAHGH